MPPGFTASLANRLDGASALDVREAAGGEPLSPGVALLAPGGSHLRLGEDRRVRLSDDQPLGGLPEPLAQTPSQTVGPFFGYALPFPGGAELVPAVHPDAVRLHGQVLDGAGEPVPDALLELWQPDAAGVVPRVAGSRRRSLGRFTGFGRAAAETDGAYEFSTLLPGPLADGGPRWALLTVFARGLAHHLFTRAYFIGEGEPEPTDALLARVPAERRSTLLARQDAPGSYRFDVRLQGERETVFLDYPAAP
jgi:protocatechuate 3,4-dioxygenase alpha subunit